MIQITIPFQQYVNIVILGILGDKNVPVLNTHQLEWAPAVRGTACSLPSSSWFQLPSAPPPSVGSHLPAPHLTHLQSDGGRERTQAPTISATQDSDSSGWVLGPGGFGVCGCRSASWQQCPPASAAVDGRPHPFQELSVACLWLWSGFKPLGLLPLFWAQFSRLLVDSENYPLTCPVSFLYKFTRVRFGDKQLKATVNIPRVMVRVPHWHLLFRKEWSFFSERMGLTCVTQGILQKEIVTSEARS